MEAIPRTKIIVIEPVRTFNGLDVLVARDEGLFATEGLDLQFASLQPGDLRSAAEGTLADPVTNQGRRLERGEARMFQGWSAAALTRVLYSAAVPLLSLLSNNY
jgi:hypothetical protein